MLFSLLWNLSGYPTIFGNLEETGLSAPMERQLVNVESSELADWNWYWSNTVFDWRLYGLRAGHDELDEIL